MAGNSIAGITLAINGDLSPLNKSLKSANTTIKETQNELKEVEKLLKLDPTNTDLLAQKQKLLKQETDALNSKLQVLNDTNKKTGDSAANYSKWEDANKSIQSEIDKTTNRLSELQVETKAAKSAMDANTPEKEKYAALNTEIKETSGKLTDLRAKAKEAKSAMDASTPEKQQYTALNAEIKETSAKLSDLKIKSKEAKEALKKGDIGKEKYKALTDEVKETSAKLADLKVKSKEAKEALKNNDTGKEEYKALTLEVNKTKEKLSELKEESKLVKQEINNSPQVTAYNNLKQETTETKQKLTELKQTAVDTKAEFGNPISTQQFDALQREIVETEQSLKSVKQETTDFKGSVSSSFEEAGKKVGAVSDKMVDTGKSFLPATAGIAALGTVAIKSSIDFETAFTGVRKTVDATEEEFQAFSDQIQEMSLRIPQSASAIAEVAEAAGQLGIKNQYLMSFTESMLMLGDATNMSSDEAATSLARLANITGMPQESFKNLGSSIVALGNNMATTESEITAMSLRLAGAGSQVGMTESEIVGLSAALSSVGIEAEMGGSAISKTLVNMQVASETGSEAVKKLEKDTGMTRRELELMSSNSSKDFKVVADSLGMTAGEMNKIIKAGKDLENFGAISGMTGEQFKQAFQEDATSALGAFINGLGTAEEKGSSAIELLDDMGISETRLRDSLLRAGNASELFSDSISLSNDAWQENTALTNEAEQKYKSTESQLQLTKNSLAQLAREFGDVMLPILQNVIEAVRGVIEKFSGMDESQKKIILTIAGIVAAIGPLLIVLGSIGRGISGILMGASSMSKIFTTLGPVFTTVGTGLKTAFSTVGTVITTVGSGIGTVLSTLGGIISTVVTTAIQGLSAALGFLAANPIILVIAAIVALVAAIAIFGDQIQAALASVNNFVQGFFAIDFTAMFGPFGHAINAFVLNLKNMWDSVMQIFNGIIDFIRGVFTGDWERAWQGIVDIFGGIFNLLVSVAKAPLNGIIGLLNMAISGINSLLSGLNNIGFDLPDWIPGIGGKSFKINIPSVPNIPYLAKGAVIPPNGQFLAMLGDQRNGQNLEAPEGLIRKIVREESGAGINPANSVALNIDTFNNNTDKDIQSLTEQISYELERQRVAQIRGRG